MTLPQERSYTYADLMDWDGETRYELYNGQPVALASPSRTHQEISGALFFQLYNYLREKKCRIYAAPFDVCLFAEEKDQPEDIETVLQPDITVICDPEKLTDHGCSGAPDLVIEILSPSARRRDRLTKFDLYQRAGVREYWIVDPEAQIAQVHLLEDGRYYSRAAYNSRAAVPVKVLEDFQMDPTQVFAQS